MTTTHQIADPESDQIVASEPAVGSKMEQHPITDAMLDVEPNPDRPDFLPADEIIEHRYPGPLEPSSPVEPKMPMGNPKP